MTPPRDLPMPEGRGTGSPTSRALHAQPLLTLMITSTCPYCHRVLRALEHLDLQVELIDVEADDEARAALSAAVGRAVVPVLRVEEEGRVTKWTRESVVIIHALARYAGRPLPFPAWLDHLIHRAAPLWWGLLLAAMTVAESRPLQLALAGTAVAGLTLMLGLHALRTRTLRGSPR